MNTKRQDGRRGPAALPGDVRRFEISTLVRRGDAAMQARRWPEAIGAYRQAARLAPDAANVHAGLGAALISAGQAEAAAQSFERALALDPEQRVARFMLAGGSGAAAVQANFVRAMFDGYAERFDSHLVGTLNYTMPQSIAAALTELRAGPFVAALDLGCGTGLAAEALGPERAPVVDGIDLSPNMLEMARAKGRYRALVAGDIVMAMAAAPIAGIAYDLVVAADVFIYVGPLEAVFAQVAAALGPGGHFAYSLEHTQAAGVERQPSGRFAHGDAYTAALAAEHGFELAVRRRMPLRREGGRDIGGRLEILKR